MFFGLVGLPTYALNVIFLTASTLAEIEDAADALSNEDKEALLRFLAMTAVELGSMEGALAEMGPPRMSTQQPGR